MPYINIKSCGHSQPEPFDEDTSIQGHLTDLLRQAKILALALA